MRIIETINAEPKTSHKSYTDIIRAVETVLKGEARRVDVAPDIKVYECKNVIRIDLKLSGELDGK